METASCKKTWKGAWYGTLAVFIAGHFGADSVTAICIWMNGMKYWEGCRFVKMRELEVDCKNGRRFVNWEMTSGVSAWTGENVVENYSIIFVEY